MLGGLLKIAQSSLRATQYLALQAAQLLLLVAGEFSGLFLDFANVVFEGTVDLICIHGGLSSSQWSDLRELQGNTRCPMLRRADPFICALAYRVGRPGEA